jgi:hypothetical protein
LGIKPGFVVAALDEPPELRSLLGPLPEGVTIRTQLRGKPDVVITFQTSEKILRRRLARIPALIHPNRMVWLGWPKKTSGVATDLTGDVVRAAILETELVDVKVCAISDTWSGLKAVWRKELR